MLDVNVGTRIADALNGAGHDVVRAAQSDPRAEDPQILSRAVAEARLLVTYDRDFSELIFVQGTPPPLGILYLRFRARDVEAAIARLMPVLDMPDVEGHMTVIDERRVRHTPFPVRSDNHG